MRGNRVPGSGTGPALLLIGVDTGMSRAGSAGPSRPPPNPDGRTVCGDPFYRMMIVAYNRRRLRARKRDDESAAGLMGRAFLA